MKAQKIVNYLFSVWVKSGMYYKDFDRHIIDMMNGLVTRTLIFYGDESDDNIAVVPLRKMLEHQAKTIELTKLTVTNYGQNIRYIPDAEQDYIHSPISEKCLEQMEDMVAMALWGIMQDEPNDSAAHWELYKLSISPIYHYDISMEMPGVGGCRTTDQLLLDYELALTNGIEE